MLTSERVAELRYRVDCTGDALRFRERYDLLDIIDAYEAQRPRPASEPPSKACRVLVRTGYEPDTWESGDYDPDEERPWRGDLTGLRIPAAAVLAWLPLPEVPE